jgi:hypothetical protein
MSWFFFGFWPIAGDGFVFFAIVAFIVFAVRASRAPTSRCPHCRQVNRPVAIFCAQCGQRLPGR